MRENLSFRASHEHGTRLAATGATGSSSDEEVIGKKTLVLLFASGS
jgi:hypothetical protein